MKSTGFVRSLSLVVAVVLLGAVQARAQDPRIQIGHLDRLADTAVSVIDVTVDRMLLQLAARFLNPKRSPDEAKIKELVEGLEGVYVKRFEFEREGEFSPSDVDLIKSQLSGPSWSRVVGVRSKKDGRLIDVYLMAEGSVIKGLAAVATERKALTVVNVIGPIDVEKLSQLEGKFGIPKLDIEAFGTR